MSASTRPTAAWVDIIQAGAANLCVRLVPFVLNDGSLDRFSTSRSTGLHLERREARVPWSPLSGYGRRIPTRPGLAMTGALAFPATQPRNLQMVRSCSSKPFRVSKKLAYPQEMTATFKRNFQKQAPEESFVR